MLDRIGQMTRGAGRFLAQFARAMVHPIARSASLVFLMNRTGINYAKLVKLDRNNIVTACVNYKSRVFTDASLMLEEWLPDREEWAPSHRDPVLDLLERPNRFYSWSVLAKATVFDLDVGNGGGGDAYWFKVRNSLGTPIELWWMPAHLVEPKGDDRDPTVFISHYELTVNGGKTLLRVEDVVHFRTGVDPDDPRRGLGPLKTLFREVFSDDEAANMTAALLRNVGVPGVIISPDQGTIAEEQAKQIKRTYTESFGGDKTGEPIVLGGAARVTQFGFSPEQMQMRALRGIPEERIAANLGVSAAVVGLGTGLAQTKVGATLREYREHDVETTIVPLWRDIASELTHQLLPDFKPGPKRPDGGRAVNPNWRVTFDLSKVRVLQEDELKRTERVGRLVTDGIIRISEGRRALGWPVLPEHELYLRPSNLQMIPAGPLRVQQGDGQTPEGE